jgi:hypothetical protein
MLLTDKGKAHERVNSRQWRTEMLWAALVHPGRKEPCGRA